MKRNNTNPIYLTEILDTAANAVGVNGAISSGIKFTRMIGNAKKILDAYPTPRDLKNALLKIKTENATKLAVMLSDNMSKEDYYRFIKRHLCDNRAGLWIANALIPGSIIYQAVKGISDSTKSATDHLYSKLT